MDLGFDIAQKENGNLLQLANGDLAIVERNNAIMQEIKNEAITYPGDLFYDEEYGWGLYDFIQREVDMTNELFEVELRHRILSRLSSREYIDENSINIEIFFNINGICRIDISFLFEGESSERKMRIDLDRVGIEVVQL